MLPFLVVPFCLGTLKKSQNPQLEDIRLPRHHHLPTDFFLVCSMARKAVWNHMGRKNRSGKSPLSSSGNAKKIPHCLPEHLLLFWCRGKDAKTKNGNSHIQFIYSLELRMLKWHPKNCIKIHSDNWNPESIWRKINTPDFRTGKRSGQMLHGQCYTCVRLLKYS